MDSKESHIVVYTDRARFNQICFNLVSNAVKYTPENGHVVFKMSHEPVIDGKLPLDIYVIDDGIGMSEEFLDRICTPFEQENRKFMPVEGVGLGLSIVKEIVGQMNGTLDIASKVGEGTTVHVHLVLEVAEQQNGNTKDQERKDRACDYNRLYGKQILLVEDHPLNQQIVIRLLEKQGMKVMVAENGEEGVKLFRENCQSVDAVLMDIRMPVMDGLTAARTIRSLKLPQAKTVPIIALTANAADEDRKKSKEAGMNEHISKPIEKNLLYMVLVQSIR